MVLVARYRPAAGAPACHAAHLMKSVLINSMNHLSMPCCQPRLGGGEHRCMSQGFGPAPYHRKPVRKGIRRELHGNYRAWSSQRHGPTDFPYQFSRGSRIRSFLAMYDKRARSCAMHGLVPASTAVPTYTWKCNYAEATVAEPRRLFGSKCSGRRHGNSRNEQKPMAGARVEILSRLCTWCYFRLASNIYGIYRKHICHQNLTTAKVLQRPSNHHSVSALGLTRPPNLPHFLQATLPLNTAFKTYKQHAQSMLISSR